MSTTLVGGGVSYKLTIDSDVNLDSIPMALLYEAKKKTIESFYIFHAIMLKGHDNKPHFRLKQGKSVI